MPPVHLHFSMSWPGVLVFLLLVLILQIGSMLYERQQRRALWAQVLANSHVWAASVGGTLQRVSEQTAVYGQGARNRTILVARRYRVTFLDNEGAQCVASLRYTCADQNWAFERLTREMPGYDEPDPQTSAQASADGYARRHRGKTGNVPVIFAPPKKREPRRST